MKWRLYGIIILLILLSFFLFSFFPLQKNKPISVDPWFEEVDLGWQHNYNKDTHPFLGGAIIDIDNDQNYEIFIGGGQDQEDVLFSYNGTFNNIISTTGLSDLSATYGAISLDVDNDSDVDMIIARENGLFFYFNDNGKFTKKEIPLNLEENAVVFSVAPGDINKDGWVDLYVSTFVEVEHFKSATYNDPNHGKKNILLLNKGDNTFKDISSTSGTELDQNTFLSLFIDLNDDSWQDLVVSPNTDTIHIYKNNGDLTFSEIPPLTGYGFWMGLSVADIDRDGDQDLFFSNAGNLAPDFLLTGDLRDDQQLDVDWALFRNDGNMKFVNVNNEQKLQNLEFAWGAVLEDFNVDGYPELVVAENYIKWFVHKVRKFEGRFFHNVDGNFKPVNVGLENKHYGQSPLVVDFNNDGFYDIIYLNMDGPARAFINLNKGKTKVIHVADNVDSLGKKIVEKGVSKVFIPGQGLMTDQTPQMIFQE